VFRVFLQVLCQDFSILNRTERDMIENVYWSSCKVHFIIAQFQWHFYILNKFLKKTQEPSVLITHPIGTALFHAEGRTDMMKLTVALRNFAKAPNKTEFRLYITAVEGGDRPISKCCYTKDLQSADGSYRSCLSQVKSV
jgi:hypothetical protein